MTEQPEKERPPVECVKYFIRGAALPGVLAIIGGLIGLFIQAINGEPSLAKLYDAGALGAGLGLVLSVWAAGEIIGALLGAQSRFMNGVWQALGYIAMVSLIVGIYLSTLQLGKEHPPEEEGWKIELKFSRDEE